MRYVRPAPPLLTQRSAPGQSIGSSKINVLPPRPFPSYVSHYSPTVTPTLCRSLASRARVELQKSGEVDPHCTINSRLHACLLCCGGAVPMSPPPHSCHHFGWRSVGRQQLQQTSNRSDNFRFALCARPWVGWGTPACHGTLPSRTSWGCSCVNFNWVAVVADLPAIPGGRPASFGARTPFPSTRHQCGNQQQPKRLLRSRGLRDVPGKKKN